MEKTHIVVLRKEKNEAKTKRSAANERAKERRRKERKKKRKVRSLRAICLLQRLKVLKENKTWRARERERLVFFLNFIFYFNIK